VVEVKTNCQECIKNDVCAKRKGFEYAINSINSANTDMGANTYYEAKNNPEIVINVYCPSYFYKSTPILR
jgi:hypothetical protein